MKENKSKTILFDLDGTILNSLGPWMKIIEQEIGILREINSGEYQNRLPRSKSEILKILGPQLMNIRQYGLSEIEAQNFVHSVVEKSSKGVSKSRTHTGAVKTVTELHSLDVRLGIVSNSASKDIVNKLKDKRISQYFGSIIGRDKVKNHKPDPESLILAIGELNANMESTYMIGDSPADIEAANAIGVTSILYYPKSHHQFYEYTMDEIEGLKASYVITTLSELVNLVSKQE